MATKIGNFHQKIGHYSACIRDITKILAPNRGFYRVGRFNCASEICVRLTPVAMVTKIWKFSYKIHYNSACV